jgi:hypothetical protein
MLPGDISDVHVLLDVLMENVSKLFNLSLTTKQNKLERLSLARLFRLI